MHLVNLKRRLYVIMPAVIPSIGNIKKQKKWHRIIIYAKNAWLNLLTLHIIGPAVDSCGIRLRRTACTL